jgi:hypothetical protein
MKFGIHIGHMGGPLGEMRKLWKFADAKGFDWFSVKAHRETYLTARRPSQGGSPMWIASGCFSIVVLLVFAFPVASQQPAPKVDMTPLARPGPLAVIRVQDPATLLAKVADVLRRGGFLLRQTDTRDQFIDATRPDSAPSKNYDRVLVWLERDFQDPSQTVKVLWRSGL